MSSSLQPGMSSYCRFPLKNKKKKIRLNLTENEEWSSAFLRKTIFYQKYFFMSCLIITSTLFPLKQTNISLNMRTLLFICGILLFASFTKSKYRQL